MLRKMALILISSVMGVAYVLMHPVQVNAQYDALEEWRQFQEDMQPVEEQVEQLTQQQEEYINNLFYRCMNGDHAACLQLDQITQRQNQNLQMEQEMMRICEESGTIWNGVGCVNPGYF